MQNTTRKTYSGVNCILVWFPAKIMVNDVPSTRLLRETTQVFVFAKPTKASWEYATFHSAYPSLIIDMENHCFFSLIHILRRPLT